MVEKAKGSDVSMTSSRKDFQIEKMSKKELMTFIQKGGTVLGRGGEGEEFLMSNSSYYVKPSIDGKLILDLTKNKYVAKGVEGLINLRFTEKPILHIKKEDGEEDQELSEEVMEIFEEAGVDIYSKMKLSSKDIFQWGCFLFQMNWITEDGWIKPSMIKRLPPETFLGSPPVPMTRSEILKGIGVNEKGVVEFWQTWQDGMAHKLSDVTMLKDPLMPGIAGESRLIPLVPMVSLIDFCWKSQAQKINRVGAPALFVKFTQPPVVIPGKRDDLKLARLIIDNWGKESQYVLRENMEIVRLDFPDTQQSLQTIQQLEKDIMDYFNPATFLMKEGDTIGGSDAGKVNMIKLAIQNANSMIADVWEPTIEDFLSRNGYEGYTVEIEIPAAEPDRAALNLSRAEAIDRMGIGTANEKRVLSGLPEADEALLAEIEEERKKKAAMVPGVFKPGTAPGDTEAEEESEDESEDEMDEKKAFVAKASPNQGVFGIEERDLIEVPTLEFYHVARVQVADLFDGYKMMPEKEGIVEIWAHRKRAGADDFPGDWELFEYRFNISYFSIIEAENWIQRNTGFKPLAFHAATEPDERTKLMQKKKKR